VNRTNRKWLLLPLAVTMASPALALTPATLTPVSSPKPVAVPTPVSNPTPVATGASTTTTTTSSAGPTVAEWQALYAATPQTTPFRIPADMPVSGYGLAPGALVTAAYVPFTGTMALTKNNAYGLLSSLLTSAVAVQNLGAAVIPVANTAPQDPYENDGDAIQSCDEWVYKKYYDYRRFQDAAATCGGQPDCVYNLWAQTTVPGESFAMAPKSGIAWAMVPYPTSTLDPEPFVSPQTGTQQQLKNPFRDPTTVTQLELALQFANEGTGSSGVTPYGTVLGYLQSATFTASSPYYTITGARAAWHKQMHDQQATYGENMADRADIAARTANMETLLAAFNAGNAQDSANYEAWEARVIAACGGLVEAPPGLHPCTPTNPNACKPPPPPSPACTRARESEPGMPLSIAAGTALGNALVAEYNHLDRVTGVVDNGCLGVNHNKCDWSPAMIAQEYLTTLDAQVAADTQSCDSFFGTAPVSSLNATKSGATSDEVLFTVALEEAQSAVAAERESLTWSQTAPDTIRYDMFGGPQSWNVGGSVASASYSQQAFWELTGQKNKSAGASAGTLCGLSGRIYGSANAGGSVFGANFTLLDTDLQLGVGETVNPDGGAAATPGQYTYESHLTVASETGPQSIYSVTGNGTGQFNEPIANYNDTETVIDIPGQISWLSLDLKVNVVVGVSVSLNGNSSTAACGTVSNPENIEYSLGANVTPSVSAQAVGTALVGALGTGVGVQGTVDVLTVSLPINLTTALGFGSDGNVDVILNANASLSLDVLSGELDTAECVFGDCATQQLFSWNGIPAFNDVLWNTTQQVPVIEMQNVFQ
jgi:hypothetical protein